MEDNHHSLACFVIFRVETQLHQAPNQRVWPGLAHLSKRCFRTTNLVSILMSPLRNISVKLGGCQNNGVLCSPSQRLSLARVQLWSQTGLFGRDAEKTVGSRQIGGRAVRQVRDGGRERTPVAQRYLSAGRCEGWSHVQRHLEARSECDFPLLSQRDTNGVTPGRVM